MASEFRIGRDFPAEYQWSWAVLAPFPFMRTQVGRGRDTDWRAPAAKTPARHFWRCRDSAPCDNRTGTHDTEHVLHFGAHFAEAAIARLLSLAELAPRLRLL